MSGIYDVFSSAAGFIEKAPWRNRILVGAVGGSVAGLTLGNKEEDPLTRIEKGMFLGVAAGAVLPTAVRALGGGTSFGSTRLGNLAKSRYAVFTANKAEMGVFGAGKKALYHVPTMMLAGAGIGAIAAPSGHRTMGAFVGAGVGAAAKPLIMGYHGWEHLGRIGGAQTAALGVAGVGIASMGMFRDAGQQAEISGVSSPTGSDYQPNSSGIADRMAAMNATGDITLGLNARRHG